MAVAPDRRRRVARAPALNLSSDPNEYAIERLRFWMAQRGYTTRELNERSGVEKSSIIRILDGVNRPMLDTLAALAKGLNVPLIDFIPREDATTQRLEAYARPAAALAREMQHLPVEDQRDVMSFMRFLVRSKEAEIEASGETLDEDAEG